MPEDNNNNDNILSLASSKEDKEKQYKLTIHYKDRDQESDDYLCDFFGVSVENPDFFLIGKGYEEEDFIPVALISVGSILKIEIEEV